MIVVCWFIELHRQFLFSMCVFISSFYMSPETVYWRLSLKNCFAHVRTDHFHVFSDTPANLIILVES